MNMDEINKLYNELMKNYKETLQNMTSEELVEEMNHAMTEDFMKLYFAEIERRQSLIPNNVA